MMHNTFRLCLIFDLLIIVVWSQRGEGGGGGGRRGAGGAKECSVACKIAGYVALAIVLISFLITCIVWLMHLISRITRGKPKHKNTKFVNELSVINLNLKNYFPDGDWSSLYYQSYDWHRPYRLSLKFNHQTSTVSGQGTDEVGSYTICGVFSSENLCMGLTKRYKLGTGNPSENLGHSVVTIHLTWNQARDQFEGKWLRFVYHRLDPIGLGQDRTAFTYQSGVVCPYLPVSGP
ncbi:unnamed protein product [Rotaria magnacalcarata]|uniref:Uncharacterized protein n=1 Tax=Rotaria magnacalcarata TaxID=392030 RepID=A0A816X5C0_9BILA|nr:unnamed protein product [Rotaria magnacalcarata]CAF4086375.1 unnamed protein product [Rotaria magnacalcarata]CAF4772516.1 unnamed protein product [Rotaria magnacalcarata]